MLSEIDTLVLTDKGFKLVNDLDEDDKLTTIVNGKLTYEPLFRVVDKPVCKDIAVYDSNKNFATSSLSYCKFYNDNLNSPNNAYTLREVIEKRGSSSILLSYDANLADSENLSELISKKCIIDFNETSCLQFEHNDVIKLILIYFLHNNIGETSENELAMYCYSVSDYENLNTLLLRIFHKYEDDFITIFKDLFTYSSINYLNKSSLYGVFKIKSKFLSNYVDRLHDVCDFIRKNPNYVISILKDLSEQTGDTKWRLKFGVINNGIINSLSEILVLSGYKIFIQKHRYINSLTFIKNDRGKVNEYMLEDIKNRKKIIYADIETPTPIPIFVLDVYNKKVSVTIRQTIGNNNFFYNKQS